MMLLLPHHEKGIRPSYFLSSRFWPSPLPLPRRCRAAGMDSLLQAVPALPHLHLRSKPRLRWFRNLTSSSLQTRLFCTSVQSVRPSRMTSGDAQWNASRSQSSSGAELGAAGTRPGTAKCKRTFREKIRVQMTRERH